MMILTKHISNLYLPMLVLCVYINKKAAQSSVAYVYAVFVTM